MRLQSGAKISALKFNPNDRLRHYFSLYYLGQAPGDSQVHNAKRHAVGHVFLVLPRIGFSLVPEVTLSGKNHRQSMLVSSINHFLVAH